MGDQILNPKNIAIKRLQEENEKLHDKCKRLEKRVCFFFWKKMSILSTSMDGEIT